MTLTIVGEDLR